MQNCISKYFGRSLASENSGGKFQLFARQNSFFSVIGNVKECETWPQKRLYIQENIVLKDSSVESTVKMISPFEGRSLIVLNFCSHCCVVATYKKQEYYHEYD